jgi:gliding motility-associated-like protein
VVIPSAISASINNITHVSCFGQTTGGATAVSSGGTPNYTYSWSTQSTPSTIIATTNAISNVAAGTYRVTVTDHSGCTATSNLTILNQSTAMYPGDIASNQSICSGSSPSILIGTSASGGINSSYQWQKSFDNSIFSTANGTINTQNYTPSTLTQNTYFRRAWISVACGTVYSDTILITILPVYRDTIQGEVCRVTQYQSQGFNLPSDSTQITGVHYFANHLTSFQNCDSIVVLQLNVLPDFENEYIANSCNSYIWNDITYIETGDYTQLFQAQNGCDSTVILHLMINSSQTTNITDTVCQGNSYDKNGFYITPPVTDILQIIEQEITLNNVLGCDSVVALSLTVFDTSMTLVLLSSNFCETYSAELMVQALFENYLWNTGETSPIITVDKPGYYTVTGFNNYCEKTANYTIQPCKIPLYLPNSFTPNGDGLNDYFSLTTFYADQIVEFNIVIFNRWGQKLFESYDPYFKWDGKFNNEMVMKDQTYNYLIKCRINGKGSQIIKGVVMVL